MGAAGSKRARHEVAKAGVTALRHSKANAPAATNASAAAYASDSASASAPSATAFASNSAEVSGEKELHTAATAATKTEKTSLKRKNLTRLL